jgi:predicted nucleic-acid-binding Zn-ribbon protein
MGDTTLAVRDGVRDDLSDGRRAVTLSLAVGVLMRRSRLVRHLPIVAAVAATMATVAPAAGAGSPGRPVRSGTVLNPAGYTGPGTCDAAPDCVVWLRSHCDVRLTGQDPAVFASIVNIRSLRGTRRTITATGSLGNFLTDTYYEFWSSSCQRVGYVEVYSRTVVTIPSRAEWMTVPGQVGPYHWEMR